MRVRQTPTFKRAVKRLHANQKADLDGAVRAIAADPGIGAAKTGDLAGIRVHKFHIAKQRIMLAYAWDEAENALTLLALGSHGNFYRDLKK